MSDADLVRRVSELERRLDDQRQLEGGGWQFIEERILTSSVASITFSNLSAIYKTLVLQCEARTDAALEGDDILLRFNGDSGANYDWSQIFYNTGTGATGATIIATNQIFLANTEAANSRANNYAPSLSFIYGHADTDREKWVDCIQNGRFGNVSAAADVFIAARRGRWRNTSAITSIVLVPGTGPNFVSGSRFRLYGIL